jgi:hypothetical protein
MDPGGIRITRSSVEEQTAALAWLQDGDLFLPAEVRSPQVFLVCHVLICRTK